MGHLMGTTATEIYEGQECFCVEYGHVSQVEKLMETATRVPPFLRHKRADNVDIVLSVLSRHRYIFLHGSQASILATTFSVHA